MTAAKISEFPIATSLIGNETVPILQDGINKKVVISQLIGAKGDTGATGAQGPKGDTGDSGTSLIIKNATVYFPVAKYAHITVNVIEPTVTTVSRINAWLAPNTDWDADDLAGYSVTGVPKTGSIDFYISGIAPIVGNFDIYYFWI